MTIPFWAIVFAIVMPNLLAFTSEYMRFKQFDAYDNQHPREQSAKLTGAGARMWAAQQNAWEALMMFAPSVLIAHTLGANAQHSAYAALLFCVARILHAICYYFNWSTTRSLIHMVALGSCFWLFYLAATA